MNINSSRHNPIDTVALQQPLPEAPRLGHQDQEDSELGDAFGSFVGQTLFGQMFKAMRKTVGEPAYFHGGRGEEIFREQLDQVLAEKMSNACSDRFSQPMFELFNLKRM
jgi:peptidoglycan hydrolase FlgJ